MVGQVRQGFAILATMTILWAISVSLTVAAENARFTLLRYKLRRGSGGQRGSFRHSDVRCLWREYDVDLYWLRELHA